MKDDNRLQIPQHWLKNTKYYEQTPVPGEKGKVHCGTCKKSYSNIIKHNNKWHKPSVEWQCEACHLKFKSQKTHLVEECTVLKPKCPICENFKKVEEKQHPERAKDLIINENYNYRTNLTHYRSAFNFCAQF